MLTGLLQEYPAQVGVVPGLRVVAREAAQDFTDPTLWRSFLPGDPGFQGLQCFGGFANLSVEIGQLQILLLRVQMGVPGGEIRRVVAQLAVQADGPVAGVRVFGLL